MERSKFLRTVRIISSSIETISSNKFYNVFVNGTEPYIYDDRAKKKFLDKTKVLWKEMDNIVMFAKITWSVIDSILVDKVYRVFDDEEDDERYIIDEENTKVLFDGSILKYETI